MFSWRSAGFLFGLLQEQQVGETGVGRATRAADHRGRLLSERELGTGCTETRAEGPGFGGILACFSRGGLGALGSAGRRIQHETDAQIVPYWSQNPPGASYL